MNHERIARAYRITRIEDDKLQFATENDVHSGRWKKITKQTTYLKQKNKR